MSKGLRVVLNGLGSHSAMAGFHLFDER
jgi:hypothetical protein